jgi:hypothetical protein
MNNEIGTSMKIPGFTAESALQTWSIHFQGSLGLTGRGTTVQLAAAVFHPRPIPCIKTLWIEFSGPGGEPVFVPYKTIGVWNPVKHDCE